VDKSTSPNEAERVSALQLGRASYRVSAAGIFIGIVVGIFVLVLWAANGVNSRGSSTIHHMSTP